MSWFLLIGMALAREPGFRYERPFALDLGESLGGPDGLVVRYVGVGPVYGGPPGLVMVPQVEIGKGGEAEAGWPFAYVAGLPDGTVARSWWGGLEITAVSIAPLDPYRAEFVVSRRNKHRQTFSWDVPFRAERGELWVSPDGTLELVETGGPGAEAFAAMLSIRSPASDQNGALPGTSESVLVNVGRVTPVGDWLIAGEPGEGRMELRIWRPAGTVRPLAYGKPFRLFPGEKAEGEGIRLQVSCCGNMWFPDRAEEIFGSLSVERGGVTEGGRFSTAEPTVTLFGGTVRVTVSNLSAARYDGTQPVEVLVEETGGPVQP